MTGSTMHVLYLLSVWVHILAATVSMVPMCIERPKVRSHIRATDAGAEEEQARLKILRAAERSKLQTSRPEPEVEPNLLTV